MDVLRLWWLLWLLLVGLLLVNGTRLLLLLLLLLLLRWRPVLSERRSSLRNGQLLVLGDQIFVEFLSHVRGILSQCLPSLCVL